MEEKNFAKTMLSYLLAFFTALLYSIIVVIIGVYLIHTKGYTFEDITSVNGIYGINVAMALILAAFAIKLKTEYYKGCLSPLWMFFLTLIFGPMGVFFSMHSIFQIKLGNAYLISQEQIKTGSDN